VTSSIPIDFGATARDYAVHRRPFAAELYARLRHLGIGLAGQRVLDLAAGTGLLGRPLARAGCRVIGVDVSAELLSQARAMDGPLRTGHAVARAERLPFASASFDVVLAGQCWHWFDRTTAPAEVRRVLVAGGKVAAVYQTHIPLPRSVAEATEQLILRHRPSWRHANSTGINGQVLRDLQSHGFTSIESFSFDITEPFMREDWRGIVRTWSAVGASLSAGALADFDREHAAMLESWPEPLLIPHRLFAAVATRAGDGV
jgi:ubiquinone/menaquinone biosynthesis C-methylase UbiE